MYPYSWGGEIDTITWINELDVIGTTRGGRKDGREARRVIEREREVKETND